jgi:type VI secretion system protein ImpK
MSFHPPSSGEDAAREGGSSRRGQLALALQEVLTATVRLRTNRQVAADADSFRAHVKQLLAGAERDARRIGYTSDDVALALYAVIAFLDESVLNSTQPMFASWPSRPLQEEVFGGHMGGEVFFQHLRQLLARQESEDVADVLEVFRLCLLLGFQGRYSTADAGELRSISAAVEDKLRRIRGGFTELSPAWALPSGERVPRARDPWLPWLSVAALASIVLVGVLFGWFRSSLDSAKSEVETVVAQAPS